ncbi:hypothetical protein MJV30_004452 [Salmonella enterica]|nr:hypothetical protein [Salmonella enterica]
MMEKQTPYTRFLFSQERGVNIATGNPCKKCSHPNAIYYYTRPKKNGDGVILNGCIWCAFVMDKEPPAIKADVLETKPDGTLIYTGRKCRNAGCDCKEHLAVKAHGAKAGACYECAIRAASEREGQTQVVRLRNQIKQATNQFIIQSIERAGDVNVAPADLSEYFLVRALMEERNRLNEIAENGVIWEIGHKFPASGGGTEYRGKATVNNLCLVEKRANRSMGDGLPTEWTISQVITVGDAFTKMTQREAATAWRERMGWDSLTAEQKTRQKAAEVAENDKHTAEVRKLAARLMSIDSLKITPADEWQAVVEKITARVEAIDKKQRAIIKNATRAGESIFFTENMLTEEALHGLKARYRIIYNTMRQLTDIIEREEKAHTFDPFDEMPDSDERNAAYCRFLSESQLIKTAFLMWQKNVLQDVKRDVQGFTHPLLSKLNKAYVWGTKTGADGKQWLCGWLVRESGEWVELDLKKGAVWQTVSESEFKEQEISRKNKVQEKLSALVAMGERWCAEGVKLSETAPIDVSQFYDPADAKKHTELTRRLMIEDAKLRFNTLERKRAKLNTWWCKARLGSASDTEKQAKDFYLMFSDYEQPARAGNVNPYEYAKGWQTETENYF